ncbi:MAG: DsrE/DsrF/DrsH-like family protein [Candidatus Lokiarchaeota archaeon]|nr:DsrE/DsrF/DrsH-like family protein [Candidatus Harpocratesius repetitus]
MSKQTYIVIGGVAGGASAAVRLRRVDEHANIIMIERGEYISFANCGLPYHIGDVIKDEEKLLVETPDNLRKNFNIDVRIKTEAISINPLKKSILLKDLTNNNEYEEQYDKLILSPGAQPLRPPILGINASNIFTLRNIPDMRAIKRYIENNHPIHATVIGGGFIGLEMAENLAHAGLKVTVNELAPQVMAPLDPEMAAYVHQHLKQHEVELYLSDGVKAFEKVSDTIIRVELQSGKIIETNIVILGIGVKPERKLAEEAGLTIGERGGILVNEYLQTSDPDIYAIGDAIEVKDLVNKKNTLIPLAGPANKQGRIAANNIAGKKEIYKGTQGTSIAKIFDLTIATTGNNEKTLRRFNIPYRKSYTQNSSHAGYYPNAIPMAIKLLFSPENGKILGCQIVGYEGVDKRIDVLATALRMGLTVFDLEELELAYAPPYSSAKDPVNIAGFVASNILKGDMDVFYPEDMNSIDFKKVILLDIRTNEEVKLGAIPESLHIPLDELRDRMNELDKNKEIWVYCQAGQRGYYASRILVQNGFQVKNLSGGYKAYKIVLEKQSNEGIFDDLSIHVDDVIHAVQTQVSKSDEIPDSQSSIEIDACGLACPGPIMRVAEHIKSLNTGEVLKVTATDPGFYNDIKIWAETTQNKLLKIDREAGKITAFLKKEIPKPKSAIPSLGFEFPDAKNMIVFSSDFDKAIASFIIANGAVAMGKEVNMFFTFWGLNILRKPKKVRVNKSFIGRLFGKMMPRGSDKLSLSQMNMGGLGTKLIKYLMKSQNIASLRELIQSAQKNGVKLIACQMTMDLMGIKKEELIDGVEIGGVATMLGASDRSNMTLFI